MPSPLSTDMSAGAAPGANGWQRRLLPGWIALALIAIAFGTTLRDPFLADDYVVLEFVRESGPLAGFVGPQADMQTVSFYRPLLLLSFWLDDALWGTNAFGFRLTNLVLHLLTGWLLWSWVRELRAPPTVGAAAVLLWGLSSAAPGDVAWIAGRSDVLSTFFCVAATLAAWRGRAVPAILLAIAAGATKETGYAAPLIVAAFLATKPGWRVRGPLLAAASIAALLVVRRLALGLWIGGYAGGQGLVPGPGHVAGLADVAGHLAVPNAPLVGTVLSALVALAALALPGTRARLLAGATVLATLPLAQQWAFGGGPGLVRLYGMPFAFACLTAAQLAARPALPSWTRVLFVVGAANAVWSGGLRGIGDFRGAGEQIRRSDEAVAAVLDETADLILLAGTKRLVGTAPTQTIGVRARYALLHPESPPVWPLHQVYPEGTPWGQPDRPQPVALPFRFEAGWLEYEGPRKIELDGALLRASADGAGDLGWNIAAPAGDDVFVVLLTPAGQNQAQLSTNTPSLRDVFLARLSSPVNGQDGAADRRGTRLLETLVGILDGGIREACFFFRVSSGPRSAAVKLVLAEDLGELLLPARE